ncbi:MAG: hypothetical protein ABJN26_06185 [Stappiaceae bacterium]
MTNMVNDLGKYDRRAIMITAHEIAAQYRAKGVPARTAMKVGLLKAWAHAQVVRAEYEADHQTPEAKQATTQFTRNMMIETATRLADRDRRAQRYAEAA